MTVRVTGGIVFTDIVGFTELTDLHGDDVALSLLDLQDRQVRAALPPGARIVKELGDGLLLWFPGAREAIASCVDLQHRLATASVDGVPLWIRVGAHWGCPSLRGDDLVGHDVNLAARICALAGPGEVLCSGATAAAAGSVPGVTFEPLGPVYVRGVAEPVPLLRVASDVPAGRRAALASPGVRLPTGR